ncbi:uncharacterized protein LOC111338456 [Stylophora pistillata]|uniref:uncharacterized protein LOC111338456 n=1 Tax=Stylophora pistillata TaxID=50429 RepID=UPI000C0437C8|nr:uncharacterized protein LOC111338456 [Stylophora pistillata]XP_022800708.1 uncharacterized protein LOC111338456 [Stylophora pistillata]
MIDAPDTPTIAIIGKSVRFRWHYNSGDLKDDLYEVVFGIWKSPGFLKTKLIAVNSSGFSLTRPSYESSVGWAGNLTSSMAVFELYNVKLEESKTYGIVVEYGLQHTPLTDTVQLQVVYGLQAKLRHTDPPKTATPQQRNGTTAVYTTNKVGSTRETVKEPSGSVPRKTSKKFFFMLAVASGVIVFGVITSIVLKRWCHHRKKGSTDVFETNLLTSDQLA